MAVPKRRTSKTRTNSRRAHIKLRVSNMAECANCGEMKRNHHVCSKCGYYAGKEVISK